MNVLLVEGKNKHCRIVIVVSRSPQSTVGLHHCCIYNGRLRIFLLPAILEQPGSIACHCPEEGSFHVPGCLQIRFQSIQTRRIIESLLFFVIIFRHGRSVTQSAHVTPLRFQLRNIFFCQVILPVFAGVHKKCHNNFSLRVNILSNS